jgi:hypothetical protein
MTGYGYVKGADTRMRVGAAQDGGVEHIRQLDIVHKRALAGHQFWVFTPFQRLACVGHARPRFLSVVNGASDTSGEAPWLIVCEGSARIH